MIDYTSFPDLRFSPFSHNLWGPFSDDFDEPFQSFSTFRNHPRFDTHTSNKSKPSRPFKIQKTSTPHNIRIRLSGEKGRLRDLEVFVKDRGPCPSLVIASKSAKFRRSYKLDPEKLNTRDITYAKSGRNSAVISIPKQSQSSGSSRARSKWYDNAKNAAEDLSTSKMKDSDHDASHSFPEHAEEQLVSYSSDELSSTQDSDDSLNAHEIEVPSSQARSDIEKVYSGYHSPTLEEVEDEDVSIYKQKYDAYLNA